MFKGIGSILILAGSFGLGLLYRERMNGRIRALQQLMDILELLESEVRYGRSVLPECCKRVGEQTGGSLGEALSEVARRMQENEGISFSDVFTEVTASVLEEMPLVKEDRKTFIRFASPVGFTDGQMQQRAMEQCRERLGKTKEKLEQENAEKGRIAVGLGAMSGLLLILILW